jgi:hypothetical protein
VPPLRANISRISVDTRAKAQPSEQPPPAREAQHSPNDKDETQAVNGTGDTAESNLPAIIVRSGERHLAADAGLAAIAAAGIQFYRRDRALVRVCRIKAKRADGGEVFVPAVTVITMPMLARALGLSARWWKHNRKRELVGIDPPEAIAEQILGMIDDWPFPPLRGVIATQTMRHDGTLLIAPGYEHTDRACSVRAAADAARPRAPKSAGRAQCNGAAQRFARRVQLRGRRAVPH